MAATAHRQALNGLVFFFREAPGREPGPLSGCRPARPGTRFPTVLTRDECRRLFAAMGGTGRRCVPLSVQVETVSRCGLGSSPGTGRHAIGSDGEGAAVAYGGSLSGNRPPRGQFRRSGAPEPIRTADLLLRRQLLYPSELRERRTGPEYGRGGPDVNRRSARRAMVSVKSGMPGRAGVAPVRERSSRPGLRVRARAAARIPTSRGGHPPGCGYGRPSARRRARGSACRRAGGVLG